MKLKTLNDTNFLPDKNPEEPLNKMIRNKIKQEAINWVKYLNEKEYILINEKRSLLNWIVEFFNITESDLKELQGGKNNDITKRNM